MSSRDPIKAIRDEMDARGTSVADMRNIIGPRGRVSEILNKRRPLTLEMIRNLMSAFDMDANLLVRRYALRRPATDGGEG